MHARATTQWLVMRFLWLTHAFLVTVTTSNGSEGNSIQLNIVKLFLDIHLLKEAFHLIHCEGDALLSIDVHHPLK